MISRVIVSFFCAVVLLSLMMQMILMGIPFVRKLEFENICHYYAVRMEESGGLPPFLQQELVMVLESKGFEVESIYADNNVYYGNTVRLFVDANIQHSLLNEKMEMEVKPLLFCYNACLISRRLGSSIG